MNKIIILVGLLLFVALSAFGQVPDLSDITKDNVFDKLLNPVISALVLISGILAGYIPALKKVNKATFVLIAAVVIGVVAVTVYKSSIQQVIFSVLAAITAWNANIRQAVKEPIVKDK